MNLNLVRLSNFVDGMASVTLIQPDTFSARLKKTMRNTGLLRRVAQIGDEAALHRVMRDRMLGQACYTLLSLAVLGAVLWLALEGPSDAIAVLVALLLPALAIGCQVASVRLNERIGTLCEDASIQPC